MNIQIYMQFFPIENDAFNRQPRALCAELARRGHNVMVISDDSWLKTNTSGEEEHLAGNGGWRVYRIKTLKNMKANLIRRLRTYTGYACGAYNFGKSLAKPDVIYASLPSFFTGMAASRLARKSRVPLVVEVRDLWPDDLVARKLINPLLAAPMYPMVDSVYRHADRLISLTPGIKTEIIKHGIAAGKIDVIPVGCDKALFTNLGAETRTEVREKYHWGNDFVAVYPGTHTEATALDVVIRAMAGLKDLKNFRVAFFGQGQTKEALKRLAAELDVGNIEFHDPVGKQEVARILLAADIGLLNLQKSPLSHIFFENKFMDYMVAGLPIFGSMDGQQADIIKKYDFGRIVHTADAPALAEELRRAVSGEYQLAAMGRRAYEYGLSRLDMDLMIKMYADRIEQVAAGSAGLEPWAPNL